MKGCFAVALTLFAVVIGLAATTAQASPITQHSSFTFPYPDALLPPDQDLTSIKPTNGIALASPDPGYYETSEYLIGSVAVGIVFLESNGYFDSSTESWTSPRESLVVSEITSSGLTWLEGYNLDAHVSFVYDINYRVPTRYEPIRRPYTDQGLWISEAMTYLGHSGASYFSQVRDYVNDLRDYFGTDWAFTIFVVDSYNDSDGKFSDGRFAYAYLGGPFLVMTYDNDGWGIGNMDNVAVHETLHIFYATDEYDNEPEYSGYLNIRDNDGAYCIMNPNASIFPIWSICSSTKQQVGWRDTDGDKIQDIVDTSPDTSLFAYSPDPTNDATPTYTGIITEIPYPNNNPKGGGSDVTINTITSVQYRVDSGSWFWASPTDGFFDETEETFSFTAQELPSGNHSIEARGTNSVGNVEMASAIDFIVIDTILPITSLMYSTPSCVVGDRLYITAKTAFTMTASDGISGVRNTYYNIDSSPWITYSKSFSLSGISEGAHIIHYYSVDEAGNKEKTKSTSISIDNSGPAVSTVFPRNGSALAFSSVDVSWSSADSGCGIDHHEVRINAESYIDTGTLTNHVFSSIPEGSHRIYIKAFDKLGNSKEFALDFLVDISAPTVSVTSPTSKSLMNSSSFVATWKGSDAISGISHYEVRLDDETWMNLGTSTMLQLSAVGDGPHELLVKAIDEAGNSALSSVTFVVDVTSPVVSITSPKDGSEARSSSATITWSGEDEVSGIHHYEVRLDKSSWVNVGTLTEYTFAKLSDGSHQLTIKAVDRTGNYKETWIGVTINTSFIGGPGWLDDIFVFGGIGIVSAVALSLYILRRRK